MALRHQSKRKKKECGPPKKIQKKRKRQQKIYNVAGFRSRGVEMRPGRGWCCFGFAVAIKYIITVS